MIFAQETMTEEIIVDNFAGGGGASTGIELATGRQVAIAINHDPDAILMHRTNHPYTEHLQASVWDVDPKSVCRGRPVGLAWFSPDCKHFSKAKGAALVDRKIRGLAWITLRWAAEVRPRVIILENVEEFQTWGPVRKGKPVKKLAGTTFRRFISQLEALGYTVEFRELVAADFGAPTSRKRFYMIARCDGKPIVWPKPTYSKTGADGLSKWRSAAEIIDWSLPCPSVFASKAEIMAEYGLKAVRPLAKNTMRRIIRGVDKFTIRSGKPFIVQHKFQNAAQNIEKPLTTVTAVGAHELCKPLLAPVTVTNTSNSVGATVGEPMNTVRTGGGGGQMLVTPFLAECNHSGGGHIAPVGDAHKTITAKHTGGIVAPTLIQYHTEQTEAVRASGLGTPINTVDASNRYGLTCANLVEYYTGGRPRGDDLGHWPEIRALLNEFCGYALAEDEVILLEIGGALYYIADIGLRMLSPRELYNAMGFPPDYIIDRDYLGNEYGRSKQVARCGNAVCPPVASALVRANLPEWCGKKIATMAELLEELAV